MVNIYSLIYARLLIKYASGGLFVLIQRGKNHPDTYRDTRLFTVPGYKKAKPSKLALKRGALPNLFLLAEYFTLSLTFKMLKQ
jgi:hypothetical protein